MDADFWRGSCGGTSPEFEKKINDGGEGGKFVETAKWQLQATLEEVKQESQILIRTLIY
jgi:hypothetical protein